MLNVLSIVNCNPIISPTIKDTNKITVNATGDSNIMIKSLSNAQITFNANALKGASIVSKSVKCGSAILTKDGTIKNVDSGTFEFSVTDSRGNTTTQTISNTLINYIKPTVHIKSSNVNTNGLFTITISGQFYNGKIGSKNNKDNLTVGYYYSGEDEEETYIVVNPVINGNNYSITFNFNGADYRKQYSLKGVIKDLLTNQETKPIAVMAKPVFEWGKDVFCINSEKTEGNIYGLNKVKMIESGADLNDIKEVGVYGIISHSEAANIANMP